MLVSASGGRVGRCKVRIREHSSSPVLRARWTPSGHGMVPVQDQHACTCMYHHMHVGVTTCWFHWSYFYSFRLQIEACIFLRAQSSCELNFLHVPLETNIPVFLSVHVSVNTVFGASVRAAAFCPSTVLRSTNVISGSTPPSVL